MLSPLLRVRDDGWVPKERYTGRAFFEGEMERLWPRVWQIACCEEELPDVGDYVVYDIGVQSIVVVRTASGTVAACHNACPHPGTRPAGGHASVPPASRCVAKAGCSSVSTVLCPRRGWCAARDGKLPFMREMSNLNPQPT